MSPQIAGFVSLFLQADVLMAVNCLFYKHCFKQQLVCERSVDHHFCSLFVSVNTTVNGRNMQHFKQDQMVIKKSQTCTVLVKKFEYHEKVDLFP